MNADIGILTSNEEGLSNSILEYMSYGLPVIATRLVEMLSKFLIIKMDF